MIALHRPLLAALLLPLSASVLHADNWPNWRGPHHNGSSSEKGFPAVFSREDGVIWKATLPGEGASTPVVWDKAVFLTSVDESQDACVAMRIDADSGKIVWSEPLGKGIRIDERSTYAGSSAVTDGKWVWFFSGNGDLAAYDFDGNRQWHRNIEEDYGDFAFQWTFSSSPLLYDGLLYLQVLQRDVPVNGRGRTDGPIPSFLLALDPATGKTQWQHIRPTDAVQESHEAFSTPVPILHEGRPEILIAGGDCLTGHDPATGKELWRWGTYNPEKIGHWRLVPSPVYGAGTILVCAPKGAPVYGIAAGGNGNLLGTSLLWQSEGKQVTSDVPTPLFYDGYFYILNDRNKYLSCVHPVSGTVVWSKPVGAKVKLEA
ncbi:MAG TPA: PQQ-binding-like beta-propeller repeat protein, partial [Bacteroidia bacterium]|nr:PQQ-binding-like beta-propeller repeat protein [Bacteroidia bacterium]